MSILWVILMFSILFICFICFIYSFIYFYLLRCILFSFLYSITCCIVLAFTSSLMIVIFLPSLLFLFSSSFLFFPFSFFCSLPSFSFILVNFLPSSFLLFLFSPSSLLLYSPVVSEGQYNKIWSYIDEARDLGYKFLYGGDRQLVSVDSGNVIREKVSYQLYSLSSLVFLIPFL